MDIPNWPELWAREPGLRPRLVLPDHPHDMVLIETGDEEEPWLWVYVPKGEDFTGDNGSGIQSVWIETKKEMRDVGPDRVRGAFPITESVAALSRDAAVLMLQKAFAEAAGVFRWEQARWAPIPFSLLQTTEQYHASLAMLGIITEALTKGRDAELHAACKAVLDARGAKSSRIPEGGC